MSLQRQILSPVTTAGMLYEIELESSRTKSCTLSTAIDVGNKTKKPVWNKGLTKEIDPRVKKNAESLKKTLQNNPEISKQRAIKMWENPERRVKQSLGVKQSYIDNPNLKEIRSISAKNQWKISYSKMIESLNQEELLDFYKNHMKQLWLDENYREKQHISRSKIHKKLWNDPTYREKKHKELSKNRFTLIERIIFEGLKFLNIPYSQQFDIDGICFADVVLTPLNLKIAIFCDGDYWHKFPNGLEKDKIQTKKLQEKDWIVLRFWEHEIKNNPLICLKTINTVYLSRLSSLLDKSSSDCDAEHGCASILPTVPSGRFKFDNLSKTSR